MGGNYARDAARAAQRGEEALVEARAKRMFGSTAYTVLPGALTKGDLLPRGTILPPTAVAEVIVARDAVKVRTEDGTMTRFDPSVPVTVIGRT